MKTQIAVATSPNWQVWFIENGRVTREKETSASKRSSTKIGRLCVWEHMLPA
jgi:hypothetical protein